MKERTYFEKREISCTERLNSIIDELPYYVRDFFIGVELRTSPLTRLNYGYDLRIFFDFLSKKVFKDKEISKIELSDLAKYDLAIKLIAEQAPNRICENEKLSGAATLVYAVYHLLHPHWNEGPMRKRPMSVLLAAQYSSA